MEIQGKNIILRTVSLEDAKFLYDLRKSKGKFLSPTGSFKKHQEFLKNYKIKEKRGEEYYFLIIDKHSKEKIGAVRMYDFTVKNGKKSFCWGSWIIKDGAPTYAGIESALNIYETGFYNLGFDMCHFDVRKENEKVVKFHQRFGAKIVDEDSDNFYFEIYKKHYEAIKPKYKRYLP